MEQLSKKKLLNKIKVLKQQNKSSVHNHSACDSCFYIGYQFALRDIENFLENMYD